MNYSATHFTYATKLKKRMCVRKDMTIQKRGILMTMTRKIVMMKIILVMRKMLKESNRCNVR